MAIAIPIIDGAMALVNTAVKRIWPDASEAEQRKLEELGMVIGLDMAQMEVNKAEAAHPSMFVAGWRPFIGWTCGISLAYTFIGMPVLAWASVNAGWVAPPDVEIAQLVTILVTMLGMSGLRTYEGSKGTKRSAWKEDV